MLKIPSWPAFPVLPPRVSSSGNRSRPDMWVSISSWFIGAVTHHIQPEMRISSGFAEVNGDLMERLW